MLLRQFQEMKKMMRSVSKLTQSGRKITSQNLALEKFLKK
jgi:signal recognition particle subunit SRP54